MFQAILPYYESLEKEVILAMVRHSDPDTKLYSRLVTAVMNYKEWNNTDMLHLFKREELREQATLKEGPLQINI